jgi:hypothetical protein
MTTEYFETCSKKRRGMAQASLDLINAMYEAAEAAQPITGRGIGYKLFAAGLIPSMARNEMQRVYRLLREAREKGIIPWDWIVDETRSLERTPSWDNPTNFARAAARSYRRDFWNQQDVSVEVWSEKGTVRGVLKPVLDDYGVGFIVTHGFNSATGIYDIASSDDSKPLIALYCGDWDPSGLCMSEHDLPKRIKDYGGDHVELRRIALVQDDLAGLPPFSASEKKKDPRYRWFTQNHGKECWELDAMDPNDLRDRVQKEIEALIEPVAWKRCAQVNGAEQESLRTFLDKWCARERRRRPT